MTALLAAALVSLALAAPAGAAPLTRPELPSSCREFGGEDTIALACDPGKRAVGIHLRLGAAEPDLSRARGIAQLSGREPLQVGETLTLTWSHPSSHAVLAVTVAAPEGPREVVLDLRARLGRVDVTAQAAGALQVTTPTGNATVRALPAAVEVSWRPRTARAAATRLLGAVDRLERGTGALRTLCAALDRDVFDFFELFFDEPQRYPCPSAMAFVVFGDENVPRPTSSVHHGFALAVHRGRALLSTRLVHRYRPSSRSDPTRVVVRARVLLVRDRQGIWRLATIEPLLPLGAVDHRRAYSDAELERAYRAVVALGRKAAARAARHQAARQAATADGAAPAPCAVALAGDRTGDVVVEESDERARNQAAHADVDLVGVGGTGGCVALRSAGVLPAHFDVVLSDDRHHDLAVIVDDGRVLVEDEESEPTPVPGVAAHLDSDGLVLSLPFALTGTVSVTLGVEIGQVSYSDVARVKSAR
jgi:hypothetical protein